MINYKKEIGNVNKPLIMKDFEMSIKALSQILHKIPKIA